MIGKYDGAHFLGINLYGTDIPKLEEENTLECITWGIKNILIQLRVELNQDKRELNLNYVKNKLDLETLSIIIDTNRFQEFLENSIKNTESDLIGTRGRMEGGLPFDRLTIIYYNEPGINASKNLDPLTINPSLKKRYSLS